MSIINIKNMELEIRTKNDTRVKGTEDGGPATEQRFLIFECGRNGLEKAGAVPQWQC